MWNAICDLLEYMEYIRQTGDIENMKRMRIEKRYDVRKERIKGRWGITEVDSRNG